MNTPRQLASWKPTYNVVGEWWPKDMPHLRYPGTLKVENGTAQLTITAPPIGQEVFALGSASTLHGVVSSGTETVKVTLWDRSGHYLDHHNNGTDHSRRFTHVLNGTHIDDYETSEFQTSAVMMNDLGIWSRFRSPISDAELDEDLPNHTIATLHPYRDLFDTQHSVSVQLEYPGRVEITERFPHGAMVNHQDENARVVFHVSPPAPALFHELLVNDFQALLTFCFQSGAPLRGEWIGSDADTLTPLHRRDSFRDRSVRHLGDFQMILTPDQLQFGEIVENWWKLLDDAFPAPQVLTSYLHAARGLLEQSTASVLAATENIHTLIGATQNRFAPETITQNKRVIKEALPGASNASFRAFVGEKLQENRPTLETRLHELVEIVTIRRFDMLSIDASEWVARFKAVRNKLAHTGAHVSRRGDSSAELELVNSQTRPILALLLLSRMGSSNDTMDRAALTLGSFPHRTW